MSETEEGLGRRGFLKGLVVGGAVVAGGLAGKEFIDWVAEGKFDLSNPENLEEFVGKEAYLARFKGEVKVREGSTIHQYPTFYKEQENDIPTTNVRPETDIASVSRGETFAVNKPLLVLNEAREGEGGNFIKEINTADGGVKRINIKGSWAIFGVGLTEDMPEGVKKEIEQTPHKVGCVEFRNLDFEPNIEPGVMEYPEEFELGI